MKKFNIHEWQAKQIKKRLSEQENGELAKDAQKLADHPLLDRINTRQEWMDLMKAIFDKGDEISQVSDSIKRTWLQNTLKIIGKEKAPSANGASDAMDALDG